jgi:hypothetical protein
LEFLSNSTARLIASLRTKKGDRESKAKWEIYPQGTISIDLLEKTKVLVFFAKVGWNWRFLLSILGLIESLNQNQKYQFVHPI